MSISTKPPSGTRDFLPAAMRQRRHVFSVIEEVYRSFGFEELQTPTMERLTTLLGKYGDEGDQLLFKVLQRGDKLTRALEADNPRDVDLADLGLRYDLTVPLARVYAQSRNELPRIFKRFQIQPVWRADRPQRGRYREFYQCDVDVVGSTSMTVEAEVTSALSVILERLKFEGFRIHFNHRQLLTAMMSAASIGADQHGDALVAIDKLDKIGVEGVVAELGDRGIDEASVTGLVSTIQGVQEAHASGGNSAALAWLRAAVGDEPGGAAALDDLEQLMRLTEGAPSGRYLHFDPFLARGLSYYTGPIFEIRSDDFAGSIGGGGRYDGLIGMFMKEDVPACGFSLGVERIIMLMEERGMFADIGSDFDVLITTWNNELAPESLRLAAELRAGGLRVDVYTADDKLGKQFKYADERNIPVAAVLAPSELEGGVVRLKDLRSGGQSDVSRAEVVDAARRAVADGLAKAGS